MQNYSNYTNIRPRLRKFREGTGKQGDFPVSDFTDLRTTTVQAAGEDYKKIKAKFLKALKNFRKPKNAKEILRNPKTLRNIEEVKGTLTLKNTKKN